MDNKAIANFSAQCLMILANAIAWLTEDNYSCQFFVRLILDYRDR